MNTETLPPPADWTAARNLRLASRLDNIRPDTAHGRGLIDRRHAADRVALVGHR